MDATPTADSLGAGLVLDEDQNINVVLMVGQEGNFVMAVPMDVITAESVIASLQKMVDEAHLVQEAVLTMPMESAQQYMENWAARQRGHFN